MDNLYLTGKRLNTVVNAHTNGNIMKLCLSNGTTEALKLEIFCILNNDS